ncbi:Hypothetical protein, putative [Bodo saltans]|uniref:Uncharacterized protein n=1 Tax=Bodo saltans TaxID=75058 RepID=A0A0S4KMW9_BODSA|nr:Hypothetical protein, putative [Bodo saltans]|eukprot:CUI14973.1 Hypothetical protein, putative [Bodo saltans]
MRTPEKDKHGPTLPMLQDAAVQQVPLHALMHEIAARDEAKRLAHQSAVIERLENARLLRQSMKLGRSPSSSSVLMSGTARLHRSDSMDSATTFMPLTAQVSSGSATTHDNNNKVISFTRLHTNRSNLHSDGSCSAESTHLQNPLLPIPR